MTLSDHVEVLLATGENRRIKRILSSHFFFFFAVRLICWQDRFQRSQVLTMEAVMDLTPVVQAWFMNIVK